MNDVAKRLKVILDANGNALIEDTDSLRRLLLRGQPDGPPEVRTLVWMAERGAVQHLFRWAKTPTEQRPAYVQMRNHIAQKFATAGVLPASEVRWAVDTWVDALPALAQHARQAPPGGALSRANSANAGRHAARAIAPASGNVLARGDTSLRGR